jgi:hypothetical protein
MIGVVVLEFNCLLAIFVRFQSIREIKIETIQRILQLDLVANIVDQPTDIMMSLGTEQ